MALFVIVMIALLIIVIDLQSHRIPNQLNLVLAILLLCDTHAAALTTTLFAIVAMFAIFISAKIGGGDIKLALSLILTQGAIVLTERYFLGIFAMTALVLVVRLLAERHLIGSVAFAPVLLTPFLWVYLAI